MTEISLEQIKDFDKGLKSFPAANAIHRAISSNGINKATLDPKAAIQSQPVFSVEVKTGKVANQMASGRCWMFAALNTMRHHTADLFNISDKFELSQSYTFFWDKFEKANYFYNNVVKTADLPLDDRKVSYLMATPQQDGGQWDMICAIIEKYGLVPQSVFPESYDSSHSFPLNRLFNRKLRKDAVELRSLAAQKSNQAEIDEKIKEFNSDNYRLLSLVFGDPADVAHFDFEYRDEDKNYHLEKGLTPKSFFEKFVNQNLEDYVSIINAPTADKPYNKTYTIENLGNVVGGREVKHLNVELDTFKQLAVSQLKDGQSVWFGVDMGPQVDRDSGIMDLDNFAQEDALGIDLGLSKAEQLDYGDSLMTHAMVLTGVDLDENGKPLRWKVENSWGEKAGKNGYFVMSDAWMSLYAYQVVVNKKYLSPELVQAQSASPKILDPWDPMGALA
ncbi:C1 family peptidase [Oenococcus kitaharae]|uniref:Aminopeptidase n=1 Tax=Oenococcus kitaharae DSM 17330 TaxID=1045004 RepID=G9WIH3_9LACO|nr:C1 family peptidase [Oenococcus kitaharae]EHN58985.1 Aminopeptidase C [Oenococcus kitaharae DSM 17330]OEY81706.1 aminopeptidase C [Oenococcus kitaharae]OEY83937.1 aminopeptidase C [Oenococcus kitaharae]OEY85707.1 aminopeptidase C [Oenococcus kitaharae]